MDFKNTKIIFISTSDFGVHCLNSLIKETEIVAVVTQPDKKVGRKQQIIPSPIKRFALENKIKVLQPEKIKGNTEFVERVKDLQPDLIIVVAYGFILTKEILEIPKYGVINIHASLLPKYRGASPIQAAILNGDKQTGVSIMLIDEQMDHGPVLAQKTTTITDNDNFASLHDKLAKLGSELLLETLPKYIKNEIKPVAQDESKATYCQLIKKDDGKIDWRKSAEEIERQIRAYTPWPGAFTFWEGKQVKVLKSQPKADQPLANKVIKSDGQNIGEVFKINEGIGIQCGKEALEILELQIESKKPMDAKEFLNGHPEIIGAILK